MSKEFKHNVIAIVYDFDGTLTPQPMQEYTVLPEIGIRDGKKFWEQVNQESARTNGEAIVTYMRLMLEESQSRRFPVTAPMLKELAKNINYFPGVETYFKRINDSFGHLAGDTCLEVFAETLGNNCRASDFIFRMGGEEFLILTVGSGESRVETLAEKIRTAIEAHEVHFHDEKIRFTVSCWMRKSSFPA